MVNITTFMGDLYSKQTRVIILTPLTYGECPINSKALGGGGRSPRGARRLSDKWDDNNGRPNNRCSSHMRYTIPSTESEIFTVDPRYPLYSCRGSLNTIRHYRLHFWARVYGSALSFNLPPGTTAAMETPRTHRSERPNTRELA